MQSNTSPKGGDQNLGSDNRVAKPLSRVTRRDALKMGGAAALGIAFSKPIIRSVTPRPAFASYDPTATGSGGPLLPPPELTMLVFDWPDPVTAGRTLKWRAVVTNDGPGAADDVLVSRHLPSEGLTFLHGASDPRCAEAGGAVTCAFGPLASGETAYADFATDVDVQVPDGTAYYSTFTATGMVGGLPASTATVTVRTTVKGPPDLRLTLFDWPDPAAPGGTLKVKAFVTNQGPHEAKGVNVSFTLPAGLTLNPAASDPGCTLAGSVVACSLGNLPAGASAAVAIATTVGAGLSGVSIFTHAAVSSHDPDPDISNNGVWVKTTVA